MDRCNLWNLQIEKQRQRNMHPHTDWAEKLYAYLLISWAFVLSPFSESSLHRSQNMRSAFFNEAGFLPAKEAPGISSSERITGGSLALLDAIYTVFIYTVFINGIRSLCEKFSANIRRWVQLYVLSKYSLAYQASYSCIRNQVVPRGRHLWIRSMAKIICRHVCHQQV